MSHALKEEKPSHIQLEATRVMTDVEMLSGKLLELNMQDEGSRPNMTSGKGAELRVCGDHTDQRDVIMLSAKAKTESAEVKMRQLDTKALIKAALLNAEQRRQQHESGRSSESGRPVTAMQRQREREEKRRRKMEKAKEKRKQKKNNKDKKGALELTDEDRSLLERWQSMQHRDQPAPKTTQTTVSTGFCHPGTNGPEPAAVAHTVTDTAVISRDSFHAVSDHLHQHLVSMALGLDTLHRETPVIPNLAADGKPRVEQDTTRVADDHTSVIASDVVIPTTGHNHLPTYHEAVQAKLCSHMKTTLSEHNNSSNVPFLGSFAQTLPTDDGPQVSQLPNLPGCDKGQLAVQLVGPDIKAVPCSDDPPTLACTPKGTGSGYGVGLDLDGLLHDAVAEQKDREREGLDSAPLSASLIADWLEVSGNMNIHDIEAALQQELEISSPILTHISP